jgi:hypothetical protein
MSLGRPLAEPSRGASERLKVTRTRERTRRVARGEGSERAIAREDRCKAGRR